MRTLGREGSKLDRPTLTSTLFTRGVVGGLLANIARCCTGSNQPSIVLYNISAFLGARLHFGHKHKVFPAATAALAVVLSPMYITIQTQNQNTSIGMHTSTVF